MADNSCDPNRGYYPGVQGGSECFRFTDKSANENERDLMDNWWREQISLYGQEVDYYVHTYNTLSADNFYGEDPNQVYHPPIKMIIALELNENAVTLSKFGFVSDDEIKAYIHIKAFTESFEGDGIHAFNNQAVEPKSQDLFQLTEYGNTRPGNRSGKIFEITERLDQDIQQINTLAGHYVWLVKAKRYEYSFERGVAKEHGIDQVNDDTFSGKLSGGVSDPSPEKTYDENNTTETRSKKIFDMTKNDTDIYGNYY